MSAGPRHWNAALNAHRRADPARTKAPHGAAVRALIEERRRFAVCLGRMAQMPTGDMDAHLACPTISNHL